MNDWKESNIKSLGTVFTNNTFSRDCLNYDSGEYQNIHYGDVLITFSDVIDANSPLVPYINSNETVKSDTFIEDGDIIVADTAEDETVGKVCEIQNVGKRKIVSGLHTLWYRPNKNEFAPKYLGYLLNTFECHKQLVRKAHGIKVLSINKYPASLNEQNAIAGIISKVDQCIENTQKTIDATQKLKKSLMQNLLTGRMKPDGTMRKDDEFYEHPKMGKVPLGWEVKKIKEVYNRKTDTIDPTKSKDVYPYLGLEHIVPNEFRRIGNGFSNETAALKVIFNKGDLLYGKLRPYLNKVFISDIDGVGSTEFLVFEQNEYTNWLYFILQTTDFLNFTKSMTAGTQHPRVSWNDIKKRFIAIPEKDERDAITYILNSLSDDNKRNKIEYLYRLKKSLMQNLLTGKKRIDVDKINSLLYSMK